MFILGMEKDTYHSGRNSMLSHINIGTGVDVTTKELAKTIKNVVGFKGDLIFDTEKPDGAPRKLIDVSRMTSMGWRYTTTLEAGLAKTYKWYLDQINE